MPKDIDREEVQRLLWSDAQLVEVMPPEEYQETGCQARDRGGCCRRNHLWTGLGRLL